MVYDTTEVGIVRNAFCSDETWYGRFEMTADPEAGAVEREIADFVEFCIEWNERARACAETADPAEFNRFSAVVEDGRWQAVELDGTALRIAEAPVFFRGGDVTWRVSESG